jgi:hypothetical protein
MFEILAAAEAAKETDWGLEILKLVLPAVFSFLAVLSGLWVWHLRKRSEPRYQSLEYFNRKSLESLLKAWSLLAYMTEVVNPKAIVVWEKKGDKNVYYVRPGCAREYIGALAEMFYDDGYGLLLGAEVKYLFYTYRNLLYGVLLKAGGLSDGDERIQLENENMVNRMKEIYNKLNSLLREEVKKMGGIRQEK